MKLQVSDTQVIAYEILGDLVEFTLLWNMCCSSILHEQQ